MKRSLLIKIIKWIKHHRATILLAFGMIIVSCFVFKFQLDTFHRQGDTFFYLVQDLAFLPLDVLFVTLILERVLSWRDKLDKKRIIHVVISAFYSEMGTQTIRKLAFFQKDLPEIKQKILITPAWSLQNYDEVARDFKSDDFISESRSSDLQGLKDFMLKHKAYLLTVFQNNNLLEHATFTETLWSVYHLYEELISRPDLTNLPEADYLHLSVDISRCFKLILIEWVYYMKRLKKQYPYLYSLAIRKNPFFEEQVIIGREY